MMMAIDAGPTAAPVAAPRVRKAISAPALHAAAVRAANTDTHAIEIPYTRRCPCRSPSFPMAGPTTAKASSGPVTTQVTVLVSLPSSSAMRGIDTDRMVMVKPTENSPNRATESTTHG